MKLETVRLDFPEGCNIILGISHFIKTVEDLYEAVVTSMPNVKFGLAFCEASGACLIRHEGTDEELRAKAAENMLRIGAGHSFLLILRNAYPINVLNAVKQVQEVCSILCATSNPVEVIVAETEQGRGILGVIDGFKPKGIEKPENVEERREFLRRIGYKR
ncbi:MAG: adenosine monophosphate-protein transferase [Candidatus Hecatellales archaeon]|nr:MAG: adenosine monophosphate-protein transferase [Candidatus Hecatellales archaeon]